MKLLTLLLATSLLSPIVYGQQKSIKLEEVEYFNKISVGPMINLEFTQGETESVEVKYRNVEEDDINIKIVGKTLKVYLDKSKYLPQRRKEQTGSYYQRVNVYERASVTAVVTVRDLKKIESRGEERIYSEKGLITDKLKIKAYGESDIRLNSLKADRLKVVMYGTHNLKIKEGIVKRQVIKGIGDNVVKNTDLLTDRTKVGIIGESHVRINARDYLRLSSLGETTLEYSGLPRINRWFTIGENDMHQMR
ncbi:DUF2807 domain-containing protein [Fulvivirga sp. M361]|uniref:GIN domain-containing protein n=1 Tax=Fulvivirga sp. M361 TaxID=2594266 RepID=UPI0011798CFC|nr:DUF2807 domain-containing protein [Fulvivirga sp. M361]TRX51402.1 DUF2807 domain-containing protein [Fulvivirga sp. M361]